MRELKWYIKQFLFMQIKLTVMMSGITYLMSKIPDQQYSMVPPWMFGIMVVIVTNIVFPLGFIVRYISEWKPMIHKKYNEKYLSNKYEFLLGRFNK